MRTSTLDLQPPIRASILDAQSSILDLPFSILDPRGLVLGELLDHPASTLGYLSQRRVGVGGHGMAHHRQQVAIGKTVGVSEGPLQVEAVGAIDGSQAFCFGYAERMRASYSPREAPVLDLKLRTESRVNAQSLGQRLQKQVERARKQDDEMAGALVPAQPPDGLRRKTRLDLVLETLSRQTPEARRIFAAQVGFYRLQPQSPRDGGFRRRAEPAGHFTPAQFASPAEEFDEDSFERRARDERAVDVEDRSNSLVVHLSNCFDMCGRPPGQYRER